MSVIQTILYYSTWGVIAAATLEALVMSLAARQRCNWRAYLASLAEAPA